VLFKLHNNQDIRKFTVVRSQQIGNCSFKSIYVKDFKIKAGFKNTHGPHTLGCPLTYYFHSTCVYKTVVL